MTDGTYRTWDITFKVLGIVALLCSAYWTVRTYRDGRIKEQAQQDDNRRKDEVARTKDQNSFIFQRQAALYFDASRIAATLAKSKDPKILRDAKQRFNELYWGELVIVEDRRVELAMIVFSDCLDQKGKSCPRFAFNQFGNEIDSKLVHADAALDNLALELSACTRSALKKDRDIVFGEVAAAKTTCPYD